MAQIAASTLEERFRELEAGLALALSAGGSTTRAELLDALPVSGAWVAAPPVVDVQVRAGGAITVALSASLAPSSGTISYGYRLTGPTAVADGSGAEVAAPSTARALESAAVLSAGIPIRHPGLAPGWYRVESRYNGAGTVANRRLLVSAA